MLIWPHIKELFPFWGKLTKSKQPKCKSYETLKDAVKDRLIIAKLQFFSFVASVVEPYLTSCQTDIPMAPYIYFDLKNLVVNLLKLFIKSEVIENCKTSSDILNLDVADENNWIKLYQITIGFAAETSLRELKRQDNIENREVKKLLIDCRSFLISMIQKIFQRSPLKSSVIKNVRVFDPKVMISCKNAKNESCLNAASSDLSKTSFNSVL